MAHAGTGIGYPAPVSLEPHPANRDFAWQPHREPLRFLSAEQADRFESSGGTEANTLRDTGMPIMMVTCRGHKSGKVRKVPLMRVEHEGEYAIIGSKGGAPTHPGWYYNLVADPRVIVQDGTERFETTVRLVEGEERAGWWERAVAAFPPYAEYEVKAGAAGRTIPVFISYPKAD